MYGLVREECLIHYFIVDMHLGFMIKLMETIVRQIGVFNDLQSDFVFVMVSI